MAKIKLCGIQHPQDITYINDVSIDYAGFIFAPSKRQIQPEKAAKLIQQLTHAKSVGVFVNSTKEDVCKISKQCHLDVVQLHGDETQEDINYIKAHSTCEVWKVIHIHTLKDIQQLHHYHPDRFLVDYYEEGVYGGSGKEITHDILAKLPLQDMILAGGIRVDNVKEKLAFQPYAIDFSSSVETDGRKDKEKIENFMKEVIR